MSPVLANTNRQIICELLNITDEEYMNYVLDKAEVWLTMYLGDDEWSKTRVMETKSFWLWWENQWNIRNNQLLNSLYELMYNCGEDIRHIRDYRYDFKKQALVLEMFNNVHSIQNLNIKPNRMVMDETYAKMIGRAIDESL